jgi:hypothetical protein
MFPGGFVKPRSMLIARLELRVGSIRVAPESPSIRTELQNLDHVWLVHKPTGNRKFVRTQKFVHGTRTWVSAYAACKRSGRPPIPSATSKRRPASVNPDRPKTEMPRWISIAIPVSAGFFTLALFFAACFVPSIRLLHAFQALIYVAVIYLTRRKSPWGFGAGCIIGAFWNYIFLRGAAVDVRAFLTGRVIRPDVGLQLAATVAHFVLIVACAAGFWRLKPSANDWAKFLGAGILAIGYLLLLMITMRPEYIPLLKRCFGM